MNKIDNMPMMCKEEEHIQKTELRDINVLIGRHRKYLSNSKFRSTITYILPMNTYFACVYVNHIMLLHCLFDNLEHYDNQSWALALYFQVRSPLSALFISMDRYRSSAHLANLHVRSLLNRSKKNQWFALGKER